MTALYKDGTVTLVQGSPDIVGNDTGWKVALIVGGTVFVEAEGGSPLPILPDDSDGANLHPITNTQMTAAIKWTGASGTYNYAIVRDMSYSRQQSANADALALYLQRLNNPSLAAVSGLVPEADSLILFTGPDTATVIQRASLVQGVDYDEDADDIAGRNLYSSEAKGFSVLVANAGDGRTAIFIKRSSTDGDWSVPFYLSGPVGPKGDTGATGITDAGIYAAVNAYAIRDAVLDNGSTWLAKSAVPPGNPPPVLPAQQNDYWRLLARRGTDGTGIGDVVGPDGAIAGAIVQFSDTTGKKVAIASLASPALLGRVSAGAGEVERLTPAQGRQVLGGWEFLGSFNLAGLSQLDITGLGAFKALKISVSGVFNAQASAGLRFSSDNGATFPGVSNEFRYTICDGRFTFADASSVASAGDGDSTWFPILDHGGDTGWPASAECTIRHFNDARNAVGVVQSRLSTPQARYVRGLAAAHLRNLSMNALRFSLSASTVQFGSLDIEGLRG
ncbi:fusion protein [Agrobacterium tumefaciens]|uniref:fusion protein n=1 Tax=Agrobacterium tumefaciens TaxID=358 RepID=UPI0027821F28|nr:fusion protein [Agrobacterium tumefaciens]MDP9788710.1 hypothetical protein [Agrobacterium tumefaciens]